jgi:hypothetical protein
VPAPAAEANVLPLPKLIVPTSSKRSSSRKVAGIRVRFLPPSAEAAVDAFGIDLGNERRARRRRPRSQHPGGIHFFGTASKRHGASANARVTTRLECSLSSVGTVDRARRAGTELRRVAVLLDEARRGRNGTLIVMGGTGVPKTARSGSGAWLGGVSSSRQL